MTIDQVKEGFIKIVKEMECMSPEFRKFRKNKGRDQSYFNLNKRGGCNVRRPRILTK